MLVLAGQPAQPHTRLNAKPRQIAWGQAGADQQEAFSAVVDWLVAETAR